MHKPPHGFSRRTILGSTLAAGCILPALRAQPALAQNPVAGRDLLKDKRPIVHPDGPKLGVYDPWGDFADERGVATEHLFLPWEDVELGSLPQADSYAFARGRKILITIEPWSWAKDWNVSRPELRRLILSGQRDKNMRAVLNAVASFKSPVTIRWAQEMESSYARFAWSNWRPSDYIAAFKRMVGIIREMVPRATIMWSPRGQKNLVHYYPGSQYVDVVGLTVFGLEKFDRLEFGRPRTFVESVKEGYELASRYGKPIWIAELGYEGNRDYLAKWVEDVTSRHSQYPNLKEVVYFNDKDVWPWPHGLGRPNWRVVAARETIYPSRNMP
ncbi:glycoside hydrolase family 26 protein [Sphingobium nicotianae]|uniref:GH26 domain-containing protein n=1 Tax=Sphingobium nicotianae TaxID=2782607 RepID=A0A9X1ISZ0_9SPHN|nr:glycosyl hydrolase [Sphingobium nicotianae]MBT2189091.1 hypothetical protein [Sphingobium nicotianae]